MSPTGWRKLLWESAAYYLYFVGFGEAGICAPVYRGEDYIAEIRKDCVVKDDLYYKAGEKTLHGVQKKLIYTKK